MGKLLLIVAAFGGFSMVTFGSSVFGTAKRIEGVDPTAMAVDLEGNRLYVAAGRALSVFDVSDPLSPRKLGEAEGVDNRRQLVVRNGFVYLVSRETGMRIFDCSDPSRPRLRSRYDSVEFATGIDVAGNVAFLSERINGVEFVDISDPDKPRHIAIRKTEESQSSCFSKGYLYSGEWGAGKVTVFDVRDLAAVRRVGQVDLQGFGDGLAVAGDCLFCSTGHDARHTDRWTGRDAVGRGRGLEVFSLSDPERPRRIGRVDFPRFEPRNHDLWTVRVSDGVAYCADSHNGLFAVDVRAPASPKVLDRFCVKDPAHPDWPSAAITSLAVGKGCIYATVVPGGLYAIPVAGAKPVARIAGTPPRNAAFREDYPTDDREFHVYRPERSGQARTAVLRGSLVYAAFGDAGLHVLRIGGDGFVKCGELQGRCVYDCAFAGDRLVTAEGVDGFGLYDLKDGVGFREVARRPCLSPDETVAFWTWGFAENRVVLSGRNGSMRFVDPMKFAEDSALARFSFSCQWDKYLADRPVSGSLLVAVPGRGIAWIDVFADPPRETGRSTNALPRQTNGICSFGDDRFLATCLCDYVFLGANGEILGEKRPFPGLDRMMGAGGIPRSDGRYVVLTARSARCAALYDFSDMGNPRLVRNWRLSGNPDLAAFYRGKVIIPAGHQGLLLMK